MTREEMGTVMIRLYGFEHEITIQFFELMEKLPENKYNNTFLKTIVKTHLKESVFNEDEIF